MYRLTALKIEILYSRCSSDFVMAAHVYAWQLVGRYI